MTATMHLISLKPRALSRRIRQFFLAYDTFLSKAHFITTSDHPRFESFRPYVLNHHISANPYQNIPFQATNPKTLKANQNVQVFSTTLTMIHKESSFNVKPTKTLSDFGGRGYWSDPTSPTGVLNILLSGPTNCQYL